MIRLRDVVSSKHVHVEYCQHDDVGIAQHHRPARRRSASAIAAIPAVRAPYHWRSLPSTISVGAIADSSAASAAEKAYGSSGSRIASGAAARTSARVTFG